MRAFVLRLGSAAPLGLNKYTDNNKPRACALGYEKVSPLQGSSMFVPPINYFIVLMRLSCLRSAILVLWGLFNGMKSYFILQLNHDCKYAYLFQ